MQARLLNVCDYLLKSLYFSDISYPFLVRSTGFYTLCVPSRSIYVLNNKSQMEPNVGE